MKTSIQAFTKVFVFLFILSFSFPLFSHAQNNVCGSAPVLVSAPTCVNTGGSLTAAATYTAATGLPGCGTTNKDVWYTFTAKSTNPTITLSSNTVANVQIQLLSGSCATMTSLACGATSIAATGLTIGTQYWIRIYSTTNATGTFNICITDPPPVNDDCTGAITLTSGASCVNTAGNVYATTVSGIAIAPCTGPVIYDLWYSFVAQTTNPTITLSSVGASFNTPRLQLMSGICPGLASVACGTTSIVASALTIGNTYYIRVYSATGVAPTAPTTAGFNICVTNPAPANDNCAGAVTLTPGITCVNTAGNVISATLTGSIPAPSCGVPVYDIWYTFTAKTTNPTITISGNTNFANPGLQILSGACGSLADVDCSDTGIMDATGLTIGTTYYLRVYSTSAVPTTNGTFNICITDPPPTNDDCAGAIDLTSGTACTNTTGNVYAATVSGVAIAPCTGPVLYDVWYSFVAHTATPTITLSSVGLGFNTPRLQLLSGTCGSLGSLACGTTSIVAAGLTPGTTYYIRVYSATGIPPTTFAAAVFNICITDPFNDGCAAAQLLVSSTTCNKSFSTLGSSTFTAITGLTSSCGTANSQDVWYTFVAQTAYPTITVADLGTNWGTHLRISLFTGNCAGLTEIACASNAPLVTSTTPGGAGLTIGNTYYVRVYKNNNTPPAATNWGFSICITDPSPGRFDYSKSYVNLSNRTTGGTIDPGDSLEIRVTFVVFSGSADSLSFSDTIYKNKGFVLTAADSISTRTNEGKNYKFFTDNNADADAGWRTSFGANPDTAIRINFGSGASRSARGELRNTSKPSFYNSSCIIMCTYRVRVTAAYGTKIRFGGGALTYRDSATGVLHTINFKNDSLIIYQSPGLCPNAVSATNAVGVETNGTFGTPSGGTPLARNRGATIYSPGYTYGTFNSAVGGPQDYSYGIVNNTSGRYTKLQNWAKPDGSSPQYRVFGLWDIIGDHTGAVNPAKGNSPCDTTLPVSAANPCGYMLIINSSYKTDTAFQYTVSSLCPNTYYEISAWIRNICYKCGCDSNGVGAPNAGYIPFAPGDSSGVQPNLAFDINGADYYSTGNISYVGTTPTKSDTSNRWVKRGFTYLTGASQNSFTLTIRNNAPGGGGNDWAIDDISVTTCLPDMKYSPSLNPNVCRMNPLTIYDTVRSYFNNYVYYKWQRSTDNGATWTDATLALGPAVPAWNGTAWQYTTSYTIPPSNTDTSDSGDLYRLIVATTSANLSNTNCQFSDGVSIIDLVVNNCGIPLKTDLLSFNGRLVNDKGNLSWTTSKEDGPVTFTIERSSDGNNFTTAGLVNSHNNFSAPVNTYAFTDPVPVTGKVYYRLIMADENGVKKYSRIIQLNNLVNENFNLVTVINPFNYSIEFDIASSVDSKIEVELIDLYGKIIRTNSYWVHAGINALSLPNTENLPTGTYIFRVKNNELLINRKVLKKSI